MSIEVMNAVWRHSKASGRQKLVLLAIADHQGEIGAWPSISTLARMVNASERSVQRDIQDLAEMGELQVELRNAPTNGQYKANRYWVTVGPEVTAPTSEVTDSTSEVTKMTSEVTAGVMLTLKEPLLETVNPQDELEVAFDEFWKIYPRKVEKIAARKAFLKAVHDAGLQEVMEGAKRLAADPYLPPKQFIPYPASWLNAGGWTNEPYPPRQLTLEEVQARNRAEAEARRLKEQEWNQRLRAQMEEAERTSTPPPRCEHGNSIVSCRQCLHKYVG